ncbi:hypothetical protein CRG86_004990 [Photobacterium leiognathi]|nr:hypothetical protein CRG86_004990 [Photobacterium leiognathi]
MNKQKPHSFSFTLKEIRCEAFLFIYTQATSRCLIQSEVTELNSRKTTKRNSELFPSCLTQEVGSVTRSQGRASLALRLC